jgi:hypothetical protein
VPRRLIILSFVCLAAAWSTPALADANFQTSQALWKLMDICTEQAQKAYPDYTHEGRVQRDAAREACMRANNLPYEDTGGSAPAPPGFAVQLHQPIQSQQIQQLLQQMQSGGAQR